MIDTGGSALEALEPRVLMSGSPSLPAGYGILLDADLLGDGTADDRLLAPAQQGEYLVQLADGALLYGWSLDTARWSATRQQLEPGSTRDAIVFRDVQGDTPLVWQVLDGQLRIEQRDVDPPATTPPATPGEAVVRQREIRPGDGFSGDFDGDGAADDQLTVDGAARFTYTLGGGGGGGDTQVAGWQMDPLGWRISIGRLSGAAAGDSVVFHQVGGDTVMRWDLRGDALEVTYGDPGPFASDGPDVGDPDPGREPDPDPDPEPSLPPPGATPPAPTGEVLFTADFDGDGLNDDRFLRAWGNLLRFEVIDGSEASIVDGWVMEPTVWTLELAEPGVGGGSSRVVLRDGAGGVLTWSVESGVFRSREGEPPGPVAPPSSPPPPSEPPTPPPTPGPPPTTDPSPAASDPIERLFYVGHSLFDFRVPDYAIDLAAQNGFGVDTADLQLNWGSPLSFNWDYKADRPVPSAGVDAREALANEAYDALLLAPGVPILASVENQDTAYYASLFADLALTTNPNTRVFLYQHWPNRFPQLGDRPSYAHGTTLPYADNWNDQTRLEYDVLVGVVAETNELIRRKHPGAVGVELIPTGLALLELEERLAAGTFNGRHAFYKVQDLYADELHLNDLGMTLAAATVHATLYGDNPAVTDAATQPGPRLPLAADVPSWINAADRGSLAGDLYQLAWDVVARARQGL